MQSIRKKQTFYHSVPFGIMVYIMAIWSGPAELQSSPKNDSVVMLQWDRSINGWGQPKPCFTYGAFGLDESRKRSTVCDKQDEAQHWRVIRQGDFYQLKSEKTGSCLVVRSVVGNPRGALRMDSCNTGPESHWRFIPPPGRDAKTYRGFNRLQPRQKQRICLTISMINVNTKLFGTWGCTRLVQQYFKIIPVD